MNHFQDIQALVGGLQAPYLSDEAAQKGRVS